MVATEPTRSRREVIPIFCIYLVGFENGLLNGAAPGCFGIRYLVNLPKPYLNRASVLYHIGFAKTEANAERTRDLRRGARERRLGLVSSDEARSRAAASLVVLR